MFSLPRLSLPEPFRGSGIQERFRAAVPACRKQNETIDFRMRYVQSKSIVSSCPTPIVFSSTGHGWCFVK